MCYFDNFFEVDLWSKYKDRNIIYNWIKSKLFFGRRCMGIMVRVLKFGLNDLGVGNFIDYSYL